MSVERDQSRRLADALRAAGTAARPREDCPAGDQIWAALHLELPAAERERIIDHTIECPSCAEAWRLAMEIDRERSTAVPALVPRYRWMGRTAAWAGAAAAVLVIAVGSLLVRPWLQGPDPGVRDPATRVVRSLIGDNASLPRQEFLLRWSDGPDGSRYDLAITTAELEVIADVRDLERPEYRVPPDRLANVTPGTRVLWRVVARTPEGATISSATSSVTMQ